MLSLSRSLRSSCLPVGHLVLSSCILVGLATACGEDPTFDASSLDTEDGSTAPAKGADGGRLNGDASTTDARASDPTTDDGSAPNDAGGGDATTAPDGADAGNEAGTWLPIPGASCTTIGEPYERACGQCGKQTASCSPSKIVTGFGQCTEPDDACVPGTAEANTACGFCGTTSRVCNESCEWVAQPCQGEVMAADRCEAGEKKDRSEGCAGGITRPWTCNATCAWGPPSVTCEEASRILTIGSAVGATISRNFTQLGEKIKRLTASSAPCNVSSLTDSHFIYIEVRNPNAKPAKVDIGVSTVPGQEVPNVLIAAYSTQPSDLAGRKACLTGAELSCNVNLAYEACLFGTKSPTIPANGSVWVYVGNFQGADAALTFNLSANITSL